MGNTFFTADLHLSHTNIIKYCNRPFSGVKEMNETIINNWNEEVGKDDLVYMLGDFGFGNLSNMLIQLHGRIVMITGSHDKSIKQNKTRFEFISPLLNIEIEKQPVTLCHYAMRVWHRSHFNAWHLYGHSHGKLNPEGKSWDVGVDNNNFRPLSWGEIKEIMKVRPDNFNLVRGRG